MNHKCPVNGCTVQVAPDKLMCSGHWSLVPKGLGDALYRAAELHSPDRVGPPHGKLHMAAIQACTTYVNNFLRSNPLKKAKQDEQSLFKK